MGGSSEVLESGPEVAWRAVAWRGVPWRGVRWRGVPCRAVRHPIRDGFHASGWFASHPEA
ncbi:hypothetical protein C5E06_17735 [Pseudoclavibacter sp. RFBI5]|nr:hypothetical protein C5E06_17735 [Pseudoclavibacter sp. RFBI5]